MRVLRRELVLRVQGRKYIRWKPFGSIGRGSWVDSESCFYGAWKASTSVRRLQPSAARSASTRIRVVVIGANAIERHTSVLLRITPPGTVCHAVPVQYCTVKSFTPLWDHVIVGVGSLGAFQAFWTVNTATSSIVRLPANAISTESG